MVKYRLREAATLLASARGELRRCVTELGPFSGMTGIDLVIGRLIREANHIDQALEGYDLKRMIGDG